MGTRWALIHRSKNGLAIGSEQSPITELASLRRRAKPNTRETGNLHPDRHPGGNIILVLSLWWGAPWTELGGGFRSTCSFFARSLGIIYRAAHLPRNLIPHGHPSQRNKCIPRNRCELTWVYMNTHTFIKIRAQVCCRCDARFSSHLGMRRVCDA